MGEVFFSLCCPHNSSRDFQRAEFQRHFLSRFGYQPISWPRSTAESSFSSLGTAPGNKNIGSTNMCRPEVFTRPTADALEHSTER